MQHCSWSWFKAPEVVTWSLYVSHWVRLSMSWPSVPASVRSIAGCTCQPPTTGQKKASAAASVARDGPLGSCAGGPCSVPVKRLSPAPMPVAAHGPMAAFFCFPRRPGRVVTTGWWHMQHRRLASSRHQCTRHPGSLNIKWLVLGPGTGEEEEGGYWLDVSRALVTQAGSCATGLPLTQNWYVGNTAGTLANTQSAHNTCLEYLCRSLLEILWSAHY